MKKILLTLVVVGILGITVYAANPDSFEITCTPQVTYAITISTPAGGLTFSNVQMNTTYVNSSTATITNSGNVTADWKIAGYKMSNWSLGAAPAQNVVRLLAALKTELATEAEFSTTDDLIVEATERNMNSTLHTVNTTGDNVPANGSRLLSIRLDSPTDTTYDTEQKFRIEIRAYPASTF